MRQRYIEVSIHAPTRGATPSSSICPTTAAGFNPRAHAGRDPWFPEVLNQERLFQSTRPRGARLVLLG
ncbi:protein of unknown function [Thauera humireducens]|nr:protein of unknown function [Thauera humireducens]